MVMLKVAVPMPALAAPGAAEPPVAVTVILLVPATAPFVVETMPVLEPIVSQVNAALVASKV